MKHRRSARSTVGFISTSGLGLWGWNVVRCHNGILLDSVMLLRLRTALIVADIFQLCSVRGTEKERLGCLADFYPDALERARTRQDFARGSPFPHKVPENLHPAR